MQFFLAPEQKKFFGTYGYIEFEELFSEKELAVFKHCGLGIDLWRHNNNLKKVVLSAKFAKLALLLLRKKELRYCFDEILESVHGDNIEEISPIKGVQIALLVCLEGSRERESDEGMIYPTKPGDALFLQENIDLPSVSSGQKFLLLCWGEPKSTYSFNTKANEPYYLKDYGYQFGENLRDKCHPLFR